MDKRSDAIKKLRAAVALLLVAAYVAGLVAMLASNVKLALILWVVSTLGGIGLLYWLKTLKERAEEAEKAAGNPPEET
mgnify:CR=1 FL=1